MYSVCILSMLISYTPEYRASALTIAMAKHTQSSSVPVLHTAENGVRSRGKGSNTRTYDTPNHDTSIVVRTMNTMSGLEIRIHYST